MRYQLSILVASILAMGSSSLPTDIGLGSRQLNPSGNIVMTCKAHISPSTRSFLLLLTIFSF
jgi:hypothetical protein